LELALNVRATAFVPVSDGLDLAAIIDTRLPVSVGDGFVMDPAGFMRSREEENSDCTPISALTTTHA